MNLLQKSILSTVVYYDILDYPLTSLEVFKYLVNPFHIAGFYWGSGPESKLFKPIELGRFSNITLINIIKILASEELKNIIGEKNGFYFLKGREDIIRTRIDRQKIADQKWKKARNITRWLQIVPYLKMVAVSGSLALNNTKKESDFDLLIVVKNKRIWLTRFVITLLVQLIGKRRHKKITKDRICLNHYITDKSLEIKFKSLYNAQTYAHIIPVLEIENGIYRKFQNANRWIKDYLVFWPESEIKNFKTLKFNLLLEGIAKIWEVFLDNRFGDFLEWLLKKIQKHSIEKDPLAHKKGGRVTIDDSQLEFHPDSPERKILDKYNKSMLYLKVKELAQEKDSGLL